MGGSGKQGVSTSGPSKQQELTTEFFRSEVAEPLGRTLVPQIIEAMTTGGIGARIPIAQRSVEQTRAATSKAITGTEESVARAGLRGTPFGARTVAGTRLAGESAIAGIPIEIAQALMALAPQLLTGGGTIAVAGPGVSKSTTPAQSVFGDLLKAGATLGSAFATGGAPTVASNPYGISS